MRVHFANGSLISLSIIWLIVGAILLLPAVGWFLLVVWPCLSATGCGQVAASVNRALLFGRADFAQLHDALYWIGMLLPPLALAALFIGSRLWGYLGRRQPYSFARVASVFGVVVAAGLLLLLTQSGVAESWLNWARAGCPDKTGVLLCSPSPAVPEAYRLFLVGQYAGLLGAVRLWATIGGLLLLALSLLLLWLPTTATPAVLKEMAKTPPGVPPSCQWCGVRGEQRRDSEGNNVLIPPTCGFCQADQPSATAPKPARRRIPFLPKAAPVLPALVRSVRRRLPFLPKVAAVLLALVSIGTTQAQTEEPVFWQSPDVFCAETGVHCLKLFSEDGIPDAITNLRINSLSETSAQPVLEISFNLDAGRIFNDLVKTARLHLPRPQERITTISVPGSCQLVIAALAPAPPIGASNSLIEATAFVDFSREDANRTGSLSLRAFAYCLQMNLPGSGKNNPGFPPASVNDPLYLQSDTSYQDRLGQMASPPVRTLLATVFERLQQGTCSNQPDGAVLTFNNLAAQMAVFITNEIASIAEGENWQEKIWKDYQALQPFTDNYAGIYCLLNQKPRPLQAGLDVRFNNFPVGDSDLRSGDSITLIDTSSGDIVRRELTIEREGSVIYDDARLPADSVLLGAPGDYRFTLTVNGTDYTYDGIKMVKNPAAEFLRIVHVLAVGTPEAPVGILDLPAFSNRSLDLPLLNEDALTPNQALGLTLISLILVGLIWALLLHLPRRLSRPVSFMFTVIVLAAVFLWFVSRR